MPYKNTAFKIKSNGYEFAFTPEEVDAIDIVKKNTATFNIIQNNRSVNAKIIQANSTAKKQTIEIEGEHFEVEITDELDETLQQMGFGITAGKQLKEIKAPMPGLVLQIDVTAGQLVAAGDTLLILVAMKMENSIIIPAHATIKKIAVVAGQAVEKGQLLVELE